VAYNRTKENYRNQMKDQNTRLKALTCVSDMLQPIERCAVLTCRLRLKGAVPSFNFHKQKSTTNSPVWYHNSNSNCHRIHSCPIRLGRRPSGGHFHHRQSCLSTSNCACCDRTCHPVSSRSSRTPCPSYLRIRQGRRGSWR